VIAEDDDIFGDGVNVAAGGARRTGRDLHLADGADPIRDRLPSPLEDRGEQNVKNIARPVRVYALSPDAIGELPGSNVPPALPISQPGIATRLSIVVLLFANLSNDPEQQYFADGITEDVTTDLSRLEHMLVISRNTAFTYRNKPIDTKQIGRELGVSYVLEGSVRRSGSHVRVNAQLIDAVTDAHLWAERFDGDIGDLFALQDEITSRIAAALNLELIAVEVARPTEHPDVLDYILRGRAAYLKPPSRDTLAERISMLEHALAFDPQSTEARSLLAQALAARALYGMSASAAADIARAEELASQALAASPAVRLRISPKARCCGRSYLTSVLHVGEAGCRHIFFAANPERPSCGAWPAARAGVSASGF
jgi:TolB-like protein